MYTPYTDLTKDQKEAKKKAIQKYEKSRKGFLVRLYRNMKSRIEGVQVKKHHLYKGKALLDKSDFYKWAMSNSDFHKLFNDYEISGYSRKLAPSVDRIDPSLGYVEGNMQFVSHSENSRRTSANKAVRVNGVNFSSYAEARSYFKINKGTFQHLVEKAVRRSTFLSKGVWELVLLFDDGEEIVRIREVVPMDYHGEVDR